ncbi:growth arrest-specific protein 2-like [Lytechinus variegatus]|uniref:growth arrest-specific protein 2-like n=1 Tax=Lytechinus variegatus TaxID=7654 RepID=UPI001BB1CC6F|nr:growth arrest-specific protein 2-like [Lytechinus variegatus]
MANESGTGDSLSYSKEINKSAQESLIPLTEDLAEWLSRVLDVSVEVDTLMDSLDNGVLLCKLAQLIQRKAIECQRTGHKIKDNVPQHKIKCRENATSESFFARDNIATFLSWCRELGLEDTCLFETDGLVLRRSPQNVLVCIYELARLGSRLGIEPPGLLKLEKEIEKEERNPRPVSARKVSALDEQVQKISKQKKIVDIHRISEGKYNIGGKIVLIRMLRGRHVMVRVGGGWETLESYLDKHIVTSMKRVGRAVDLDSGETIQDDYFVMNAKYKSHNNVNNNGRT